MTSTGDILDSIGMGNPGKVVTKHMSGMDHSGYTIPLPKSRARQGYVFATRPQLNMSKWNLNASRKTIQLLTKENKSIGSWIRNTLDPRLGRNIPVTNNPTAKAFGEDMLDSNECPLVDEKSAFIPLLTNSMVSATGWPDKVMGKFTSNPNRYKDVYQQVDSAPNTREPLTIDITAVDTIGNPLFHLLDVWSDISMYTFSGEMEPYWDMVTQNEKDYEISFFRIVLDETGRFLERIIYTRPGFLEGLNQGHFYDFDKTTPYIAGGDTLNFRFSFPGAVYNDPVLISVFNRTVIAFNQDMREHVRKHKLRKIASGSVDPQNNFKGYPRIDPVTLAFEWWVYK